MATISGMTGFGRSEGTSGGWSWVVEARSVNGRGLDERFRGPPGFDALERLTREAAQARFQRGQVSVTVTARRIEAGTPVRVNVDLARRLLEAGEPWIAEGRVLRPSLDGLLGLRGVLEGEPVEEDPLALQDVGAKLGEAVVSALDALASARREEGLQLSGVLTGHLDAVESGVRRASDLAGPQVEFIRTRFARRLSEIAGEGPDIAERAFLEAAALAVKADVREELDRLEGHLASARALLADGLGVGRRLDFLTQEFMRETNMLCAKAAVPELTRVGLDLKAVIDQFREQVQNVE
jgi:uncharacterized protein (TIGR00255 family)